MVFALLVILLLRLLYTANCSLQYTPRTSVGMSGVLGMPQLGWGCFQLKGETAKTAMRSALEAGFRLIDTATCYRNEVEVGMTLKESEASLGIRREEVFITSKIAPSEQGFDKAMTAALQSLERLQISKFDLLLIHWPGAAGLQPSDPQNRKLRLESWRALEELHLMGKARYIGVSNFGEQHLADLLAQCRIKPSVNQVEIHPLCFQKDLIAYCRSQDVAVQAYSPLGSPKGVGELLQLPAVVKAAGNHKIGPAAVLLAWGMHVCGSVIVRTSKVPHLQEAMQSVSITLQHDEINEISALSSQGMRHFCWEPSAVV